MMNTQIFGVPGSELVATPTAPEGVPVAPMLMDMTQEEFGMNMANLICHIIEKKEEEEEEMREDDGFVLGGSTPSGGGSTIDAILME